MTRLIDWAITHPAYAIGPVLIGETVLLLAGYCTLGALWHALDRRRAQHIPAAPDNQAGTDPQLLWECRRIDALPTTSRKEDAS